MKVRFFFEKFVLNRNEYLEIYTIEELLEMVRNEFCFESSYSTIVYWRKTNRLIGWATMRQLRIKSRSCSDQRAFSKCFHDYMVSSMKKNLLFNQDGSK
jgi:hypothetical protein